MFFFGGGGGGGGGGSLPHLVDRTRRDNYITHFI